MQRLGKNNGRYDGETIDISAVLKEIQVAALSHGWQQEVFHADGRFPWLALHRPALALPASHAPLRIYLSAGIHGDEPAGPLAVRTLICENLWPANLEIFLLPCLNPHGFERNQRENPDGIDLNRDYRNPRSAEIQAHLLWLARQPRFDFYLCLHEDWESKGFYLYEQNPDQLPSLAAKIIAAVEPVCPIDLSEIIEGRAARGGVIHPQINPQINPQTRPDWPEGLYLITQKSRLGCTLEAPSDFPLAARVNALVAAVYATLSA